VQIHPGRATVADSLMAVDALPVTSAWLRDAAKPGEPGWRAPLISRWGHFWFWPRSTRPGRACG
jgi:hypothetical protein